MAKRVFISYADEDRSWSDAIADVLGQAGVECLTHSLSDAGNVIQSAIGSAPVVVVVLSEHMGGAPSVARKLGSSVFAGKSVLFVRTDDAAVAPMFSSRSARIIDASTRASAGASELGDVLAAVQRALGPTGSGTRIQVMNLPVDADSDEVFRVIAKHGAVANIELLTDRAGNSRGIAFVDMGTAADAKAVIDSLDGQDFRGRALSIRLVAARGTRRPRRRRRRLRGAGGRGGGAGAEPSADGAEPSAERPATGDAPKAIGPPTAAIGAPSPEEAEAPPPDDGGLFLNVKVEEYSSETARVERRDGFVRGARHRVAANLATRERARDIVADREVPIDSKIDHNLTVTFQAAWLPPTAPLPLWVPAQAEETEAAVVEFDLPTDLQRVELTIVIHEETENGSKVVQMASLVGDAVEPGEKGSGIELRVARAPTRAHEQTSPDVCLVLANDTLAAYLPRSAARFEPPPSIMTYRARLGEMVLRLWSAMVSSHRESSLAKNLAELAGKGTALKKALERDLRNGGEANKLIFEEKGGIQLVSSDLDTDVPLEFVYDGPTPNHDAPSLCSQFHEALAEAKCLQCPNRKKAICAFDFWGLSRRIERQVIHDDESNQDVAIKGRAPVSLLPASHSPALFGASSKVTEDKRSEILSALREAGTTIEDPVKSWDAWLEALSGDVRYRLLVLLSHNETGFDGTLEIDGDSRSSDWLDKSFVNPHESVPGPLVLLTGCETSRPRDSLSSVVAEFLYGGAAVVIGTLAKIDYRASTEATKQIVVALQGVLSEEKDLEDRSVGEVIRQTRCALLRKGDLTGLNLVAYGDANWKFKKEETA